jgi:hypothetical protein
VILPNFGADSTRNGIRRVAEAAEELGFDSVWATEHIIVGPEAVDPYGRVYDPLVTLGWIAGWAERIGLGTSIVLVPLHNPMHLAKGPISVFDRRPGSNTRPSSLSWSCFLDRADLPIEGCPGDLQCDGSQEASLGGR